jgi:uncharacterized protein YjiK
MLKLTLRGLWSRKLRTALTFVVVMLGVSLMAGTLVLTDWFAAVWFVTAQKNGVSALGLQRVLGLGLVSHSVDVDAQAAPCHGSP